MKHKTNRGDEVDMAALVKANETTIAVSPGGAMNARGDLLGRGGRIIKHVEQRINETPPSATPSKVNLTDKRRFSSMIGNAKKEAMKVEMHTEGLVTGGAPIITDHAESTESPEPQKPTKARRKRTTTKTEDDK